jgi:hypothetical protein
MKERIFEKFFLSVDTATSLIEKKPPVARQTLSGCRN